MHEVKFDRDTLLHDLRENVMIITYTNEQNHKRDIRCTLMEMILSDHVKHNYDADKNFHAKHPNLVVVFDMDNLGYRTLNMERIQWLESRDAIQYK